jgi:hypothetical protein
MHSGNAVSDAVEFLDGALAEMPPGLIEEIVRRAMTVCEIFPTVEMERLCFFFSAPEFVGLPLGEVVQLKLASWLVSEHKRNGRGLIPARSSGSCPWLRELYAARAAAA